MKAALAALAILMASPASAECFCLKRATGLWRSYHPQSGSMKPALEPGACVIIQRGAPIDRGSIIVFRHPIHAATMMVKRLIGMPGDVIEMKDGLLVLNGLPVPRALAKPYAQVFQPEGDMNAYPRCPELVAKGATCMISRFTEALPNGTTYDVLEIDPDSHADNLGPFTVPPNHVFVLGDNRDNSNDSRCSAQAMGMGFIPAENILGPVTEITNPAP